MLSELLQHVHAHGGISDRRVKDLRTSIRYLAQALGYTSPAHCPDHRYLSTDWKATVTN